LPEEVGAFYDKTWVKRKIAGRTNKQFFNYCKTLINSIDEKSAGKMDAAEAIILYLAGMFYALVFVILLILFILPVLLIESRKIPSGLTIALIIYLLSMIKILKTFRFVRLKEVEIVLVASYLNRKLIFKKKKSTTTKVH